MQYANIPTVMWYIQHNNSRIKIVYFQSDKLNFWRNELCKLNTRRYAAHDNNNYYRH